jgi:hypothetical protein
LEILSSNEKGEGLSLNECNCLNTIQASVNGDVEILNCTELESIEQLEIEKKFLNKGGKETQFITLGNLPKLKRIPNWIFPKKSDSQIKIMMRQEFETELKKRVELQKQALEKMRAGSDLEI